jgi:hypothetical protein
MEGLETIEVAIMRLAAHLLGRYKTWIIQKLA